MRRLLRALATLGPVGDFPIAPATAGSFVVVVIAWFLPVWPLPWTLCVLGVGGVIAVAICGEAEKDLGHDAHPIVADEVIGQSLALLFAPHKLWAFAAAFVLFRIFDVWKPLGAREAQALPGGWGVVADDVIAGLTSCGVLQFGLWALRRFGPGS
ncbi:MAG: phosphatidylglycerophosphatase A [Candidatus Eisenbacteria bacterium]|uniref:Phosphatidylglycerophosphatase A n=1 Tax=Eiseniibacteriota bacterium TaxID=2212470 RepID=A0A538TZ44_UNCEI|nr:MAG: phosphatidylglycerophosphatase A [Candidatus Eisenbacteria bacterium]